MPTTVNALSASRRALLGGAARLSLPVVALLAAGGASAQAPVAASQDADLLNEILGTEHEGVAAYQVMIETKVLNPDAAKLVAVFRDHHRSHRDFLDETVRRIGGAPVAAKSDGEYAIDLNLAQLKDQEAALDLALTLEQGAANAYLDMLPSAYDRELAKAAARVAADEVMHWTALMAFRRRPIPEQAMTFGV